MADFLNPYIAGAPVVEPSMFFGRQDIFEWIEQNLSGRFVNHILVIHGQRRVGKTSVLKQIPNHLPSNFIQVFFDLQGRTHTSLDRFQWWLAREIVRAVNQACGQSIPVPERELFSLDGEFLVTSFMPEVLSILGESVLLLTFDEFDTLSEPSIQESLARPLIAYLRRLFDLSSLTFIFSIGSSGHKLENMQASYTEFFKTALYRKISFLKQEDCTKLITRPVQGVLIYEPGAADRIYEITSGHPYFTQLICHELFSLSQKTGNRTITKEDVEAVLEDVIERGTVNLKFVWDEANDLEKWLLSCLAHELNAQASDREADGILIRPLCNDHQLVKALHDQHVRCSENDVNTALVHLREKDVLTQNNCFVVELLSIWLLKNRPLDRVREELVQVNPIANRYNEIGDEFRALGQLDKAMDSYKQALTTDPSNLRAQVSIGNLQLEAKDYRRAIEGYEAALRLDDDDVAARGGVCTALLALGEEETNTGKPGEAIGYYQRILTVNPDHPEAHQRLALIFAQQAEEALASDDAEQALRNYSQALEHAPDDGRLTECYALAKEKHTQLLITELQRQSEQALATHDWKTAQEAIHRALELAPDDPALMARLEMVNDAPRLAQIASLSSHATEMESLEDWDEAVKDWEACLELKPANEEEVRQALDHARLRQKIAGNYSQAQVAIKEGKYTQAITLLQGVIALDASYKDAAELLVTCLRVRPKRELKLLSLPKVPVKWLRWTGLALLLTAIVIATVTQWPRLSPLISGFLQPKNPLPTQVSITSPSGTFTAGEVTPPPTLTAAIQGIPSLASVIEKLTAGASPIIQDDFSSSALQAAWNAEEGAKKAVLKDGALRLDNNVQLGKETINYINYLLQFDLRLDKISGKENFVYSLRLTTDPYQYNSTGYFLSINPSTGEWILEALSDYQGQFTTLKEGKLPGIEAGRWYELGIFVQDDALSVYWEDRIILNQTNLSLFGYVNCLGLDPATAGEATLDIDNWRLWDLGTPSWMRSDWLSPDLATVFADYFETGRGWQFGPAESELFENGRAILKTDGGEVFFSGDKLHSSNGAIEITFIPVAMPSSASMRVYLAMDKNRGDSYGFEYFPDNGFWTLMRAENNRWDRLLTGYTLKTPQDSTAWITVVMNTGRIAAFYGDDFLGSVVANLPGAGDVNCISINSSDTASAQLDIAKISFWNLDSVEWRTDDWITGRPESMLLDYFNGSEGLQYFPDGTGKYENGQAVLYSTGEGTHFRHNSMQGSYLASEVTFSPVTGSGYLEFVLGKNESGDAVFIDYFYGNGDWKIISLKNQQDDVVASGSVQPTPKGEVGTVMVVAEIDQVRFYLNHALIGSAQIDRSATGVDNTFGIGNVTEPTQVNISKIRAWDLGADWMRNDWITSRAPNFTDDQFQSNEGWQFSPPENEKYQNDRITLISTAGDTTLSGKELTGSNIALELTFMPQELTGTTTLIWYMGFDPASGDHFAFEYSPGTGDWSFIEGKDKSWNKLNKGLTSLTPIGRLGKIIVVLNGDWLSAFYGDTYIGSHAMGYPAPGTMNYIAIRNHESTPAQVDLLKIRFWNIDEPDWMNANRIVSQISTFGTDQFAANEGWEFSPLENEKYQAGAAVLYTTDYETGLRHPQIQGTNFAIYVAFTSREVPETASLVWFLRKNTTNGNMFTFEYFPATGAWQICKVEAMELMKLVSGTTNTNPPGSLIDLMVVLEGNRVSAFQGKMFLGSVESGLSDAGTWNELVIRNKANTLAQVDIMKLAFWNLDQ